MVHRRHRRFNRCNVGVNMILKLIKSTGGKSRLFRVESIHDDVYRGHSVAAEFGAGEAYLLNLFLAACAKASINVYDGDRSEWLVNDIGELDVE